MSVKGITLTHLAKPHLHPDYARLVIRSFIPAAERVLAIITRVSDLSDYIVKEELEQVLKEFSEDHSDLEERIKGHYDMAINMLGSGNEPRNLSVQGRLLVGAYFTSEYAFEATALFNPSIVWAPAAMEMESASKKTEPKILNFIMSARSVGEGHVSSISFRTGEIDHNGNVRIDPVRPTAVIGSGRFCEGGAEIVFSPDTPISERLLFPFAPEERNGMEDARFVRFTDDDGTIRYYATYTAYDGKNILPKLIETEDFLRFRLRPLGGALAKNKGMAIFPRKIKGRYAMLSRVDGESLYIMFSGDLSVWNEGEKIAAPRYPWEFMQIGNCGSPLELDEGWLVLTHGVGSLRRYSIGAMLLDKDNPSRITGRLEIPLISPGEKERIGYVPNVVYTCGTIIHQGRLIIPYGSADQSIAFITVSIEELLHRLIPLN
jgi:predicted GH43/DUF377 family glycosyl hydrolase